MYNCKLCNSEFIPKSKNQKFCGSSCSTKYNNKNRVTKRDRKPTPCIHCGKLTLNTKFCNKDCFGEYYSLLTYQQLLNGNIESGDNYNPKSCKKHILKEQDNKCSICKTENIWQERELVFILDHIDGNSSNNKRDNLRLVCPNCDSQLPTFKSKNKGKGRHYRKIRREQGKSF